MSAALPSARRSADVLVYVCVVCRYQVVGGKEKYGNLPNTLRVILKEEGPSALYKGAVPRMVVVGPLFAITLMAFEAQKDYMIRTGKL